MDEKQHHVFRAIKKEKFEESVREIDRALQNKKYDDFYDDEEFEHKKEYGNAR